MPELVIKETTLYPKDVPIKIDVAALSARSMVKLPAHTYSQVMWLSGLVSPTRFIAGGCFRNIFMMQDRSQIRDIDIWHTSQESLAETLFEITSNSDYIPRHQTLRAHAFLHTPTQLMLEFILNPGTPLEILSEFDFTVCRCALVMEAGELQLIVDKSYFPHIEARQLTLGNDLTINSPTAVFDRMIKYAMYGFVPDENTKCKLINAFHSKTIADTWRLPSYEFNSVSYTADIQYTL